MQKVFDSLGQYDSRSRYITLSESEDMRKKVNELVMMAYRIDEAKDLDEAKNISFEIRSALYKLKDQIEIDMPREEREAILGDRF